MKGRLRWLAFLILVAADAPAKSTVDGLASEIANWVADDEPVAIHVTARAPAAARLAAVLAELVATAADAGQVATAVDARAQGYAHFVEIEVAADATDVRAFGRIVRVGHDLWAEAAGTRPGGTVGTFVVGAKLDAELRAYLGAPAPAPVPVVKSRRLAFRAVSAGSLDLGGTLLDLAAADLDGDGKAELVALLADEVVVLASGPDGLRPVARASLDGPAPVPRPRATVGTVAILDRQIVARSSEHAAGATFTYAAGALARGGEPKGFPLCAEGGKLVAGELAAGTHLFAKESLAPAPTAALPPRFVAARCGAGLLGAVDPQGVLRIYRLDGKTPLAQVAGAGGAFAVADLDGDGSPELVVAGFRPPGGGDALAAYQLGEGGARLVRGGLATTGGVAAIAAGDFDGDGLTDVIAMSRAAGTEVEIWRFE